MHKGFIRTAAIIGALSVLFGAFGAHALKTMVNEQALATFETGVRYQFYHTLALLMAAIIYKDYRGPLIIWSGRFFVAGIFLFSFSLYLLALLQVNSSGGYKWIGAITPIGGVCFIFGWFLLFIRLIKSR
jgi:uncharacterized membrane protein YgdD (TMEM256/DUF423 family)